MRFLALSAALLLLASCAVHKPPDKLVLQPVTYPSIVGWDADNQAEALAAFLKSCAAFALQPDTAANGQGVLLAPVSVWKSACLRASLVPAGDPAQARQFFEESFVPMRVLNNDNPHGLFTGYYEPLLNGSLTSHRPYVYPVYGLPQAGTDSYSREQIDLGMLNGHAPVLAYVDDPVRLFFLHIQGSGRIQLDTGEMMRIGYAGTNGMPYVAIGKVLADKGIMRKEDITMPRLRQWLYDHPGDMWQVMWENPSYVFFRQLQGDPVGSQQAVLTPTRSLAVDARYIPLGTPVFLDTMLPATSLSPMLLHRKLLIAQDTGGAIRGPVRGDIFFGFGEQAELLAGAMKSGGSYVILLPRDLALALPPRN